MFLTSLLECSAHHRRFIWKQKQTGRYFRRSMLNIIKKEKWKIDSLNLSPHFSFGCPISMSQLHCPRLIIMIQSQFEDTLNCSILAAYLTTARQCVNFSFYSSSLSQIRYSRPLFAADQCKKCKLSIISTNRVLPRGK